jgi:membrane protease YdiL (CAAX protease family)
MTDKTGIQQLSKTQAIVYHLYPGIAIVFSFIVITPILVRYHYPPQLGMLVSIFLVAIPLLISHLQWAKNKELHNNLVQLNGYRNKLGTTKLILYTLGLVMLAFLIWGFTQRLNKTISENLFGWLPGWFTTQDFKGYSTEVVRLTLVLNLLLNGVVAPFVEEYYFRGYLLPRMRTWGKWAFVLNAVLFSLYHFWQPYIYLTLILSLLPMSWLVWKTKDLRLAIFTHCLLNIIGAVLSFGLLTTT